MSDRFLEACRAGGLKPKILMRIDDEGSRVNMVAAGVGLAFVGSSFTDYAPADISLRRVEDLDFTFTLSLIWRKDGELEIIDSFLRFLESQLGHLGKGRRLVATD
jgi:DNA-binding transcriptional LysR family regulator